MTDLRHQRTDRLHLDAPTVDDLDALYAIYSDAVRLVYADRDLTEQQLAATLV